VLAICSGAAACTTSPALAVFPAIQLVFLIAFCVDCVRASPTIRRSASILIAAASFSAAIASLITVICAILRFSGGRLVLLFEGLMFIAVAILLFAIARWPVGTALHVFEQCSADRGNADAIMAAAWPTASAAKRAVHLALEHSPPFLLTWRPCHYTPERWSDDIEPCLLWCRIV
jgi:hypothetical protein